MAGERSHPGQVSERHEQERLRRIEHAVGLIQESVGLCQGSLERLEKLMASLDEQLVTLSTNLDAATTKLGGDLDILIAAFKAAGSVTPAQQVLLDAASGIATKLGDLDAKTVAATAVEPPIVPPTL